MKNIKLKKAFTLIEVMLLLVVLSLIFASSTSVITRKHKLKPRRSVHGTYICYRNWEDGALHEIMYSGKSLLLNNNDIERCTFNAPKTASYLYVQLIGGGGAGGNANFDYNESYSSSTASATIPFGDKVKYTKDNPKKGLTPADVQIQVNNATFSSRAFKWIMDTYKVKMFSYDTAGSGANGGNLTLYYLFKSDYEKANSSEPFHWYKSLCFYGNTSDKNSKDPMDCLQRIIGYNRNNGDIVQFNNLAGQQLVFGSEAAAPYCQLRSPIYKNCPWIKSSFTDASGNVVGTYQPVLSNTSELIQCSGGNGGSGGYIASDAVDFGYGVYYQTAERSKNDDDGNPLDNWIVDGNSRQNGKGAECIVKPKVEVVATTAAPGVLYPYAEACASGACKDIEGIDIEDPVEDANGFVSSGKYFNGTNYSNIQYYFYSYYPASSSLNYTDTDALFFKQYPTLSLKVELEPLTPGCEEVSPGIFRAKTGQDGTYQYFLDNSGNVDKYGVRICTAPDVCQTKTTSNSKITGAETYAVGKGGLGATMTASMLDEHLTRAFTGSLSSQCKSPYAAQSNGGLVGESGSQSFVSNWVTNLNSNGYACTQNVGFVHTGGYASMFRLYNAYTCPTSSTNNTIGLRVSHYTGTIRLSHGERGKAGGYKALFARSFGNSDLVLLPGRGGANLDITPGSAGTAANGEVTQIRTGCDANQENCGTTVQVAGGLGGRSHFLESYHSPNLTNEQVYNYIQNSAGVSAEDIVKNSDAYEDGTYLGEDSQFQSVSFLSDLSMIEDGDVVALLGRGGDAGYVKHNCWLRPQYFRYSEYGSTSTYDYYYKDVANFDNTDGDEFDEWEGYTNFRDTDIANIPHCGSNYLQQFDEIQGQNGYPGAIVIMW